MFFSKVLLACLAGVAGASSGKFPITNGVTKNTAENKMKSKLMSKARPLKRKLEDGGDGEDEEVVIDLTGYSIVFDKCQYVKFYNVDGEGDENDEEGVLATNKFVIFKLCNSNQCSNGCSYDYAEYVVDMDTYVAAMIQMKQESVENTCNTCNENCQVDDQYAGDLSDDCQSCLNECDSYENMEDNGYGDASQYTECAQFGGDDDAEYSIGPYCSDDGSKISIGVFSDEYCSGEPTGKDAGSMLGYANGLSDYLLSATYSTDCVSCLQEVNDDEDQADDYEPETSETCQELYESAGKCESPSNFAGGYLEYYDSQSANEETICNFISSLDSGTYDQTGEIVIGDGGVRTKKGDSSATKGQKFFLTVLILSTIGLAGYAFTLHQKAVGGTTEGLSKQGGAIA
eukprot:CAMPEP_0113310272 /NCGR_PEP_ID=MMETSP0010_2-20120614/7982_1 /TAXON_ID=216773 ORGANISM="Corethron hystrix, Strain 308" /NCGR_SAMPLE_ID=MMETSP0010_2 /ASSEMBLY_ACC=CAM_ASM_000155 /LENGTH=400 /DNA_ID=CAMNT_0000165691 /DNA_START=99 /DNA_END=1301 /DNA_ORIENTATION=+ /assembly_acc=CAM_ASM_000155